MTSNNEYFDPEQVDEQIEQLQRQKIVNTQTDEVQLVNLLRSTYRVPFLAEDRASLERVRERIIGKKSIKDRVGTLDYELNVGKMRAARPVAHPRRAHLTRILSGLAAMFVVGALIGGWLTVTHLMSSPPLSSAIQEDLYTIHSGIVYHLDGSNGKLIWQHSVPTRKQSDPNHGGSAQLQVVNHVVYAMLDYDIYALDAGTGKQLWHVTNSTDKEYFWSVVDDGRMYLFSLDDTFSALNAADGAELWHNTTLKTQNGYGFSVHNGNLYTPTSGSADGKAQQFWTLDGATGKVRWSYSLFYGSLLDPPLVENGVVYVTSGNTIYALKEQSGEKIWERTVPAAGTLNLSLINGILYANGYTTIMEASSDSKNVVALKSSSGQLLWVSDPGVNRFDIPMTNGLLLAWRQHNGVYSILGLNPRTGKAVWQVPFQCTSTQSGLQLASKNPSMNSSCSTLWAEVINGKLSILESDTQPSQGQNTVKTVYALKSFNPSTGKLLSEHPIAVEQDGPGLIGASNGLLYMRINVPRTANTIPYSDAIFVAYRLSDGARVWRYVMPPFPAPLGANTSPDTSFPVLAS